MSGKKIAIREYDKLIRSHITKKDFVKIVRTFNGEEANISGFILDMSKDFLMLQVEQEFLLNGYAIIRKDQFDHLRSNKYDKTQKKILKGEGVLDKNYGLDIRISLASWGFIFRDLKKHDYHVIIECEEKEEPLFEIGPIKRIDKNSLKIQYHDPAGLLQNKLTSIKYEDITILKFGDRYSTTFKKYLKTK